MRVVSLEKEHVITDCIFASELDFVEVAIPINTSEAPRLQATNYIDKHQIELRPVCCLLRLACFTIALEVEVIITVENMD